MSSNCWSYVGQNLPIITTTQHQDRHQAIRPHMNNSNSKSMNEFKTAQEHRSCKPINNIANSVLITLVLSLVPLVIDVSPTSLARSQSNLVECKHHHRLHPPNETGRVVQLDLDELEETGDRQTKAVVSGRSTRASISQQASLATNGNQASDTFEQEEGAVGELYLDQQQQQQQQLSPMASSNHNQAAAAVPVDQSEQASTHALSTTNQLGGGSKLRIVRLFSPEATQNGTQNVTIDCMFKFDRELDQRLTIKWFFNDELEPIYQWIPELNKRVYSDKYARFLDKNYDVSEDADYLLQAYKWMVGGGSGGASSNNKPNEDESSLMSYDAANLPPQTATDDRVVDNQHRRALAARINKLAKLGGRHSRQLLDSLRAALEMDQVEWSRFRALRLIRPTTELSGRFSCSVSSLDGEDLRSTRLLVYEPAKNFSFNVARLPGQPAHYNLTCSAAGLFPRPTLALSRYRAGPLEPQAADVTHSMVRHYGPKLAATLLRQEPLPGTRSSVIISSPIRKQPVENSVRARLESAPIVSSESVEPQMPAGMQPDTGPQAQSEVYEVTSWALVDEASLSSNVISQFECLLTIEGTNYEQRQSLALQRGWHVNSAALASRSTLVSLFSALASILCLLLAAVSSMMIFRLLRRHARNRVRQKSASPPPPPPLTTIATDRASDCSTNSTGTDVPNDDAGRADGSIATISTPCSQQQQADITGKQNLSSHYSAQLQPQSRHPSHCKKAIDTTSDGVYRVPESSTFGTRYVIGGHHNIPGRLNYFNTARSPQSANPAYLARSHHQQQQRQQQQPSTCDYEANPKPLYL